MKEEEYDEVHELWESIRQDVYRAIHDKLSAQPLSADQIQFVYEKCTEDLYHVGWRAVEGITPGK